ncbi:MAG: UDP-4-amino-4,6-dideoxy-N-acetyl-beta-L-altrosamine transaminase [Candidatus Aenigmatarchaeota archaeon]|nr:MAG: UDP-4-amino-4,6-dideoxy-N-acetyl-beta-L-altrosamine transaminase [Candidatus Aenigmarchaeota archaeon]
MKIEFFKHNIGEEEIKEVIKVLNSLFLTTGDVVDEFERKFASYLGCKHAIGVMSCTAALHLSLLAYDIGPEDEVITTPMTFIATATSILHAGATPVFVDVEPETGNIDVNKIEEFIKTKCKFNSKKHQLINSLTHKRVRAIMPVHLYGHMCDMKRIKEIADKYNLVIIEDAAHCIEGERDGIKPGQLGHTACFSFYATKNITCGEGGAIVTNDDKIAEKLRLLRLHGMTKSAAERYTKKYEHWDMELLGWKYNMDNIKAALLLNQLDLIEERWRRREEICKKYEEAFSNIDEIDFPKVLPGTKSARHLFTIWVNPKKRDEILWKLQDRGIGVAVNFRAIHLLKYFKETFGFKRGMFPVAEKIGDSTISLPTYPKLSDEEINYVIETLKQVITT